tara:strand:+ start:310 stop:426 length:117 start_codon:yes stop_codon:yes gene_type:complete
LALEVQKVLEINPLIVVVRVVMEVIHPLILLVVMEFLH